MGSFTEIELDLSYLDDLEEIIVHDECGGDDVSFYREGLLASDNAKLRELAQAVGDFLEDIHCDECPCKRDCNDNNRMFCGDNISYHAFQTMRELGIEVSK